MALTMEEVLNALEKNSSPEESFSAALQDDVEKTASAVENGTVDPSKEKSGAPETPQVEDSDMAKIAEADAQGRIMARAFMDELQKLAVAPVAEYPADPGAIPDNPAVQVARGELAQPNAAAQSAANTIINRLVAASKVGASEVATPAGSQVIGKADPHEGNPPLAADAAKAQERAATTVNEEEKTGALRITEALYQKYFGEEE